MPVIAVLLIIIAVFSIGRCSAPENDDTGYEVITRTETREVEVPVPTDMPDSCRMAGSQIVVVQEATEDLSVLVGHLALVAERIGTYVEQPRAQKQTNEQIAQARDLKDKIGRAGAIVLQARTDYNQLAERCDADLKED